MQIHSIRHLWPESAQFRLARPSGAQDAVLLHFITPVFLEMEGVRGEIAPGALVLFAPGAPHAFCARGPLVHNWMHLSPDAVERAAEFGLAANALYYPQNGAEITARVEALEMETLTRAPHWEACVEARLVELFILIARGIRQKSPAPRVDAQSLERLKRLRMEMIASPQAHWNVKEMAARVNASPSWLFAAYRAAFGVSPGRDCILARVDRAKILLAQGLSVAETAERVGYSNVYHFIRQFRQATGETPGKYARRHGDML